MHDTRIPPFCSFGSLGRPFIPPDGRTCHSRIKAGNTLSACMDDGYSRRMQTHIHDPRAEGAPLHLQEQEILITDHRMLIQSASLLSVSSLVHDVYCMQHRIRRPPQAAEAGATQRVRCLLTRPVIHPDDDAAAAMDSISWEAAHDPCIGRDSCTREIRQETNDRTSSTDSDDNDDGLQSQRKNNGNTRTRGQSMIMFSCPGERKRIRG